MQKQGRHRCSDNKAPDSPSLELGSAQNAPDIYRDSPPNDNFLKHYNSVRPPEQGPRGVGSEPQV